MVQVGSGWFEITADSRGNRLADYRATRTKDGSRCFIEASCCSAVLNQIQMVLDGRSPRLLSTTDFSRWRYKIEYEPPYSSSIHNGLEMLKTVLTLGETDEMDGAIALDFYKIPEEGVPGDQWENTEVGQLIHRGKYYSRAPRERNCQNGSPRRCQPTPTTRPARRSLRFLETSTTSESA
jgi:hypothetical protein